jgi:hypothetical protein
MPSLVKYALQGRSRHSCDHALIKSVPQSALATSCAKAVRYWSKSAPLGHRHGRAASGAGVSRRVVNGTAQHGAVFLYRRNDEAQAWGLSSVIKAPRPAVDAFGLSVALSGSGRTLVVGAMQEDSNARGIDGDQTNESAPDAGAAYLY